MLRTETPSQPPPRQRLPQSRWHLTEGETALTRWEKDHPTDLEELDTWTSLLVGGLAVTIIIALVGLASCTS
jgi:hypothetical protein